MIDTVMEKACIRGRLHVESNTGLLTLEVPCDFAHIKWRNQLQNDWSTEKRGKTFLTFQLALCTPMAW